MYIYIYIYIHTRTHIYYAHNHKYNIGKHLRALHVPICAIIEINTCIEK